MSVILFMARYVFLKLAGGASKAEYPYELSRLENVLTAGSLATLIGKICEGDEDCG
jgi:hypothetical protein